MERGLLAYPSSALHSKWNKAFRTDVVRRAKPDYTTNFLLRPHESRDMLGRAFRKLDPGIAKTGIRMVTWQLPTMAKLVKWGKEQNSTCTCGAPVETTAHVMLRCKTLSNAITAVHDAVLASVRHILRDADADFEQRVMLISTRCCSTNCDY